MYEIRKIKILPLALAFGIGTGIFNLIVGILFFLFFFWRDYLGFWLSLVITSPSFNQVTYLGLSYFCWSVSSNFFHRRCLQLAGA